MFITIVLLGYVSAALLDAGMRDEKLSAVPPGITSGAATYKVAPTARATCVSDMALAYSRSNALKDGAKCKDQTSSQAVCLQSYEHKSRHDHRDDHYNAATPSGDPDNGHSLKGEIHLCEWRESLSGHKCEAGKLLVVCPQADVVQVTNAGVKAGDQEATGVLPQAEAGLPAAMQPKTKIGDNDYRASLAEGGAKEKAQGKCGQDAYTCPTGETVLRDPLLSCRFAPCAGQTSLVEESNSAPTYHWDGISIADSQSFCERMTSMLGDYQDLSTTDCGAYTNDIGDCENHYKHIEDGNVGDIEHCRNNGGTCEAGAIHNCTWSFYMEDLIRKHNDTEDNCAAKLLESKRSLDGLLHSVQDVYNQLMQWNAIVQAENGTIRNLLKDQQDSWDVYVSKQQECDSLYKSDQTNLNLIMKEMTELRAIANPDVRSAVDVRKARGYQSSGVTSESCPATYPFVTDSAAEDPKQHCCKTLADAAKSPVANPNCTQRSCTNAKATEVAVDCVDNARAVGNARSDRTAYNHGNLDASQPASFAELDTESMDLSESACDAFSSLVERVQETHGLKLHTTNCHTKRTDLNNDFQEAFVVLGKLYNGMITDAEENRTICLNGATYMYKAGVEGINGIDDMIQDAAGKIHEAQGQIARLEPMLHDVERAVDRMRKYVQDITTRCGEEAYLGNIYNDIKDKIIELQECPGRNDFIINVPHWRPQTPTTPAPTPWYEDPLAASVRSVL